MPGKTRRVTGLDSSEQQFSDSTEDKVLLYIKQVWRHLQTQTRL